MSFIKGHIDQLVRLGKIIRQNGVNPLKVLGTLYRYFFNYIITISYFSLLPCHSPIYLLSYDVESNRQCI